MPSIKTLEILDGIKHIEVSLDGENDFSIRTTTFTDTQLEILLELSVAPFHY
jgi:hypothetical protein